jgi:hypothetical protein
MKELADYVKSRLPEGTEGRVLAVTSDREVVAVAAAQWALTAWPKGS